MKKIIGLLCILSIVLTLAGCSSFDSNDGPYEVVFDSQGGTPIATLQVDALDSFLPEEVPTKDGYVFAGWYLDPEGLYPMGFNAGVVSNLTLYANWIPE
jgi:uncharacterized repeat protein (TIGR02543 family)